ncbi:hypothetical protein FHR24_000248 [Wenyingzhuangia heitensis]|uniref:Uncharacterized protein n=1 Tax=Wenyingzhuangia heitensis TaxID=1487859 RepID=A0ABX0U623_9FLAO|nr:hypothetical protein [Wenyingzhuangia heitensis]NIJ43809.1 hypothetical protein [Wenyingzhuangia heitensis]
MTVHSGHQKEKNEPKKGFHNVDLVFKNKDLIFRAYKVDDILQINIIMFGYRIVFLPSKIM